MQVTSEGVVRIVRGAMQPESDHTTTLLFQCRPSHSQFPVVTAGHGQRREYALSTKPGTIMLWDMHGARMCDRFATKSSSPSLPYITCMEYEKASGNLLLCGSRDGTLDLFDRRQSLTGPVAVWDAGVGSSALSCHLSHGDVVSTQ